MNYIKCIRGKISREVMERERNQALEFWNGFIAVWDRCWGANIDEGIETYIFKRYVILQNVTDVFREVKELGAAHYKTSTEISDVIRNCSIDDKQVEAYARAVLSKNTDSINKQFN